MLKRLPISAATRVCLALLAGVYQPIVALAPLHSDSLISIGGEMARELLTPSIRTLQWATQTNW